MTTIFELFFAVYGVAFAICFCISLYEDSKQFLPPTWLERIAGAAFMGIAFPPYLIYSAIVELIIPKLRGSK